MEYERNEVKEDDLETVRDELLAFVQKHESNEENLSVTTFASNSR